MQKLSVRQQNAPWSAPQAPGTVNRGLNREETLSVHDRRRADNSSDVDRQSGRTGQDLRVPVLNMCGEPLMPTKPGKARKLLNQGKAKVVQRKPFTIQLLYPTGETKQNITFGVDAGYNRVGFSAVTEGQELISGELKLRDDISMKLAERRVYRRNRRSRKWYRKPKFGNRRKGKGWLPPSIDHKLQSHVKLVEKFTQILPVSDVVVEVAKFDTQKMQNPEISGVEYKQGELQGYEVRQYLLEKWGHKCAYCSKDNTPLEVEHIVPRTRGGSDRVSNLTISCRRCNQKKGSRTAEEFGYPEIQEQAKKSLKSTAFMNNVRWKLVNILNSSWTYGSVTKYLRTKLGLEKSHVNDAFVIAGGSDQDRVRSYTLTQVRRNNRSLQTNRKGFNPSIRRYRYKIQPNDLVNFKNMVCKVKGVFNYGKWARVVTKAGEVININIKNVEVVKYGKGIQWL